jgi:hypothetical protein
MAARFGQMVENAEQQNWGYRKLLLHLCEAEAADRQERKRERLLKESGLPQGKTLGSLEEAQLPAKVRRQLPPSWKAGSWSGPRTCWYLDCLGVGRRIF